MDEVDAKQQTQIDKLKEHASINKTTDLAQWLIIIAGLAGLFLYLNFVFVSALNNQALTLRALVEFCGEKK